MKYIIYQITNDVNGKIYIGKHQTENINDNYFGSGLALRNAIKKYGKEHFLKEVLFVFDTEAEMNQKERELITEEFVNRSDTYNLGIGGEGGPHFKGKTHTAESIAKRTKSREGFKLSEESRQKISDANRRRVISDETRQKLAEKARQRKQTDETKKKLSELAKRKLLRGGEAVISSGS